MTCARIPRELLKHLVPLECTSEGWATLLAWKDTGVWVLDLNEHNEDAYNELPQTFDENEHLENLKQMGATWFADPADHPATRKILEEQKSG